MWPTVYVQRSLRCTFARSQRLAGIFVSPHNHTFTHTQTVYSLIFSSLLSCSCKHCPKTFNEKANFDYHMQDHTNYRPAKCTMCDKSFKNKQDLASHIRCHKDIRKYMCDVCGKRFRSQSHMVYHRYSHFEERNFHCDLCPQAFKSPHILRTHRNTVHSKVFRFECEECGRKFKRDHHLIVSTATTHSIIELDFTKFHFCTFQAHRGVHVRAKLKSGKKADQESMKCEWIDQPIHEIIVVSAIRRYSYIKQLTWYWQTINWRNVMRMQLCIIRMNIYIFLYWT